MNISQEEGKKNINSLTSLRFLMMIMIVLKHMYWLEWYFHNAHMAVNYFFMLSGFGLTYAEWISNRETNIIDKKCNSFMFALTKVKKIYVLYLVTMLICVPLQVYEYFVNYGKTLSYTCFMTGIKLVSVISLLQSVTGRSSFTHAFNSVGWFLSTLFVIYIFYPRLRIWNLKYINSKKKINSSIIICLLLYWIIAKFFYVIETHSLLDELEYCSPFIRVIPFTIGILICDRLFVGDINKKARTYGTVCEVLVLVTAVIWFFLRNTIAKESRTHYIIISKEIVDIIITMHILLIFSKERGWISKVLSCELAVFLGNITMYIYLIHFPVIKYLKLVFDTSAFKKIYSNALMSLLAIGITGIFTKGIIMIKEIQNIKKFIKKMIPSKLYLKSQFRIFLGYPLNLKNPQTFNEKLQWLKLYDHNPLYTQLADKYGVRSYIKKTLGDEYLIPLVGGPWESVEEIELDCLPEQFVLKCTHDSGSVIICTDKKSFDIEAAKKDLEEKLKNNFYYWSREWVYKNIKPQIIAEKYVENTSGELRDYKLFCFNSRVKILNCCTERFLKDGLKITWYDKAWKRFPFIGHYPASDKEIDKPSTLNNMVEIAERLSEGIPFVRIDFYEIDGKIYFGEFTFYPGGGLEAFVPEEWDYKLGEWLSLPSK